MTAFLIDGNSNYLLKSEVKNEYGQVIRQREVLEKTFTPAMRLSVSGLKGDQSER